MMHPQTPATPGPSPVRSRCSRAAPACGRHSNAQIREIWTSTLQPLANGATAPIRRSVATEDSACDRRAPLARWRVPPVASGQPCRSARRSCRGQAGAPPAAWHALGAAAAHPRRRQVAPRRAVSAPCHRAGAPGAPMLRHRRPRKQSWPDPLRRRQESPAKRHHATAPVQGSKRWERNVLPGRGTLGPSWHTPSASHASNSALCRDQITAGRQAHRAAALLYFAAVQGL
jgi:hypothetical protein